MSINDFFPIKFYLPGWPTDIIGYPEQLDSVGIYNLDMPILSAGQVLASGTIQILGDITFDVPLIPGLSVALLNQGDITEFSFKVELREEEFSLSLFALSAAIRFESSLLKRMNLSPGVSKKSLPIPLPASRSQSRSALREPIYLLIPTGNLHSASRTVLQRSAFSRS